MQLDAAIEYKLVKLTLFGRTSCSAHFEMHTVKGCTDMMYYIQTDLTSDYLWLKIRITSRN